jgi:hypothetical protein
VNYFSKNHSENKINFFSKPFFFKTFNNPSTDSKLNEFDLVEKLFEDERKSQDKVLFERGIPIIQLDPTVLH